MDNSSKQLYPTGEVCAWNEAKKPTGCIPWAFFAFLIRPHSLTFRAAAATLPFTLVDSAVLWILDAADVDQVRADMRFFADPDRLAARALAFESRLFEAVKRYGL